MQSRRARGVSPARSKREGRLFVGFDEVVVGDDETIAMEGQSAVVVLEKNAWRVWAARLKESHVADLLAPLQPCGKVIPGHFDHQPRVRDDDACLVRQRE